MIYLIPTCQDCEHFYTPTIGDLGIITDGTQDDCEVEWCGFYNKEITESLVNLCQGKEYEEKSNCPTKGYKRN